MDGYSLGCVWELELATLHLLVYAIFPLHFENSRTTAADIHIHNNYNYTTSAHSFVIVLNNFIIITVVVATAIIYNYIS